jgi:membrane-bound metal-dependent hydrolase YbcI (DUF457 family)
MMGKSHAATGMFAFWAGTSWFPQNLPALVLGSVVCTGAALLPDIDHPNATTTKTYGPVTSAFSWTVRKISGGHRNGTHSILGISILGGSTYQAVLFQSVPGWPGQVAKAWLALWLILAVAGAVRLLKIDGIIDDLLPIPVCAALVYLQPVSLAWVPLALVLGSATHVAGDMLTNGGCPLLWPYAPGKGKKAKPKRYALGLFKTGGTVENWVVLPSAMIGTVALIGWRVFG